MRTGRQAGRQAGRVPPPSLRAITERLSALINKFSRAVSIVLFPPFFNKVHVKYIHERLGACRFGAVVIFLSLISFPLLNSSPRFRCWVSVFGGGNNGGWCLGLSENRGDGFQLFMNMRLLFINTGTNGVWAYWVINCKKRTNSILFNYGGDFLRVFFHLFFDKDDEVPYLRV